VPGHGRFLAMRPADPEDDIGRFGVPENPPPKRSRALFWALGVIVAISIAVVVLGARGIIPIPTDLIQRAANLLPASHPITGDSQPSASQFDPQAGGQLERIARDVEQLRAAVAQMVGQQRKTAASVESMQQELRALQEQFRAAQLELREQGAAANTGAPWFSDPTALTFRPPVPTRVGPKGPAARKAAAPKSEAPPAEPR
jgi:hypothetical protein